MRAVSTSLRSLTAKHLRNTRIAPVRTLATSPTPSSAPPRRRAVTDLSLIAVVGAGASGLLLWQRGNKQPTSAGEEERPAFTVPVMSQTGTQSTKTLALLSAAETNARLKENEASYSVSRKSNPVYRYDTSQLASNSPIEDDSCCVILERDPNAKTKGDLMFFGVFDGHSGFATSKLLSTSLVSYVARELDLVYRSFPPYSTLSTTSGSSKTSSVWSLLGSSPARPSELDSADPIVQEAIKNGFVNMDKEIVEGPIRLLDKYTKEGKVQKPGAAGKMSPEEVEALNVLLPALSGSCALLAFLDAGRNKLHVACAGDSRAVMGTWVPSAKGGGKWRAEALSEDQTGKNPSEVARIKAEHPASEAETVIARGRVLGGLEPTRACGDSRYKWPVGMQEKVVEAFHPGSIRGQPRNYFTPPYVTARPEVVTVDLSASYSPRKSLSSFLPVASSAENTPQATRFIVLATDGLYDRLNNDEVVSLVGAHLSGVRGTQSRASVLSHVSPSSPASGSVPSHTHAPRQEPMRGEGDVYTFEDGNLGTHLIRNALGGAKREQVSVLLSIPSPLSRRYRDDITVTVVLLGDGHQGEGGGNGGVYKRDDFDAPLKAKL